MGHIPHDIIIGILLRLPAKSLIRFRSVCKPWCDSICDPSFIQTHLDRAINEDSCNLFLASKPCCCSKHESLYSPHTHIYSVEDDSFTEIPVEIDISFDLSFDSFNLLGTCNGLVCLGRRRVACLFNPSTREYKIARFEEDLKFRYNGVYGLGYDQSNEDNGVYGLGYDQSNEDNGVYGLGYDQSNEDYKLVQFIDSGEFDSKLKFRSLNDSSCSTFSNIAYKILDTKEVGTYLNGFVHWLGFAKDNPNSVVISLDIRNKVFRDMPRPVDEVLGITLGVLRGQLSVLGEFSRGVEVWTMKIYGAVDSWSKLFSIGSSVLALGRAPWKTLCFPEKGGVLLGGEKKLVTYHPKEKSVSNISYRGMSWNLLDIKMTYVGSLVPLKSGTYLASAKSSRKRKSEVLCQLMSNDFDRVYDHPYPTSMGLEGVEWWSNAEGKETKDSVW